MKYDLIKAENNKNLQKQLKNIATIRGNLNNKKPMEDETA
jgi:hypothetical protein